MMYYIERPQTWMPANRKCEEILDFVAQFKNCLVYDELSRDQIIHEIRKKVEQLNNCYPRTKKLLVDFGFDGYLTCFPKGTLDEKVFVIRFLPVRRTFIFAEKLGVIEKGCCI